MRFGAISSSTKHLVWRGGREAEGGGLLNRYTGLNLYREFESPPLRNFPSRAAWRVVSARTPGIDMANRTLAKVAGALLVLATSCGRSPLDAPDAAAGSGGVIRTGGSGGVTGTGGRGGVTSAGGSGSFSTGGRSGVISTGGSGGVPGAGGSGGTVVVRLPDGGLPALLGDGGLLSGILDAPRDSVLGQVLCGAEVRLGAACSASTVGCLLPSLGGACACVGGTYLCPSNPNAAPTPCPKGAKSGDGCLSPLSTCIGGGGGATNACICGLGTYTCF